MHGIFFLPPTCIFSACDSRPKGSSHNVRTCCRLFHRGSPTVIARPRGSGRTGARRANRGCERSEGFTHARRLLLTGPEDVSTRVERHRFFFLLFFIPPPPLVRVFACFGVFHFLPHPHSARPSLTLSLDRSLVCLSQGGVQSRGRHGARWGQDGEGRGGRVRQGEREGVSDFFDRGTHQRRHPKPRQLACGASCVGLSRASFIIPRALLGRLFPQIPHPL